MRALKVFGEIDDDDGGEFERHLTTIIAAYKKPGRHSLDLGHRGSIQSHCP